ncbi:CaiB/BaiF CoA transferase family protein [Roseiterribacter gracilis]|uniref:CoA transferase n=1 Tax=Roseiterribacter gracilis TaxID=2812848 RepID=A0A8S8XA73_9PROT|nr:CoA transferase [Rhodospirillales bacterium TMPK1]
MSTHTGPLAGIRVIDITLTVMGPYCTQILADLGADVIKVEAEAGDTSRHVLPARSAALGGMFVNMNRGKRSIVLDLKRDAGKAALQRLVESADVFVHTLRPQAIERLGFSYDALRAISPRLIYANLYGFGRNGPYAAFPAYDDVIQAAIGLAMLQANLQDGTPSYVATALADKVTGLHGVYAILAALFARERGAGGQELEIPMFETMVSFLLTEHIAGAVFDPPLSAPVYPRMVSRQRRPYPTRDGYLAVLVYNDGQWLRFFEAIGHPAWSRDARFASMSSRSAHIDALYEHLAVTLAERDTAEWLVLLRQADIPVMALATTQDLFDDPHLDAVGFWQRLDTADGPVRFPGPPVHFSATPSAIRRSAPALDEHGVAILREIGFSDAEIDKIRSRGPNPGGKS